MGRLSKICIVFKRYLANSSLHGVRYLVADGFHWTERLFWLIICALCWFGCIIMVRDSLDGFYNRPVAFTIETTHLEWQTKFPSISVCTRYHPDSLKIAQSMYQKKYGSRIKDKHVWTWLYTSNPARGNRRTTESQMSQITSDDVVQMYKESSLNCTAFLAECVWQTNFKFNCCDEFHPLKTDSGLCWVFNSIHTESNKKSNEFIMNKDTGTGRLSVGLTESNFYARQTAVTVRLNNNLAIPTAVGSNDKEILLRRGRVSTVYFTLEDTYNEPGLRHIPSGRRGCRFPDETHNFYTYKLYSNGGCLIQKQMENMLEICGCVSHLFPYPIRTPVCNYSSLTCLIANNEAIMDKESSLRCPSDCEGAVMRYYPNSKTEEYINSSAFQISQGIYFELLGLPTSRYRRYVVRSLLDLVVAVGSTAGLFMGAGILSLVEIPYWLLLRQSQ